VILFPPGPVYLNSNDPKTSGGDIRLNASRLALACVDREPPSSAWCPRGMYLSCQADRWMSAGRCHPLNHSLGFRANPSHPPLVKGSVGKTSVTEDMPVRLKPDTTPDPDTHEQTT